MFQLTVKQETSGGFVCKRDEECGACIGRGASVAEAVGLWAINSQAVQVVCDPPALLNEFSVANDYQELEFDSAPEIERGIRTVGVPYPGN